MMIFVVIFGKIAKLPSEGVPYPIFVFAAMLPWTFFATAFADASNSLTFLMPMILRHSTSLTLFSPC
jgi:ABC-type polysaccharide/polyol phosphate export permease